MKLVMLRERPQVVVMEESIPVYRPVFAKLNEKIIGMIVEESRGWILRIGGDAGAHGFFKTRKEVIEAGMKVGYTFYVED